MSTQVLERPVETSDFNKFCHVVCACSPKLSLCGAYKPIQCGLAIVDSRAIKTCPKCKKDFCQDCIDLLPYECVRCGR